MHVFQSHDGLTYVYMCLILTMVKLIHVFESHHGLIYTCV
jgi:hypothetical protein